MSPLEEQCHPPSAKGATLQAMLPPKNNDTTTMRQPVKQCCHHNIAIKNTLIKGTILLTEKQCHNLPVFLVMHDVALIINKTRFYFLTRILKTPSNDMCTRKAKCVFSLKLSYSFYITMTFSFFLQTNHDTSTIM